MTYCMALRLRESPIYPQNNFIEGNYGKPIIDCVAHRDLSFYPRPPMCALSPIAPSHPNLPVNISLDGALYRAHSFHSADQDGYFTWSGLRALFE